MLKHGVSQEASEGGYVGYDEVASLKALFPQSFCLGKSKADRRCAGLGDGLTVQMVANATWIVPRSPVHTGLRGTND
jgi:hypothetical protein